MAVFVIPENAYPINHLRAVLGASFVLFPSRNSMKDSEELDTVKRITLSLITISCSRAFTRYCLELCSMENKISIYHLRPTWINNRFCHYRCGMGIFKEKQKLRVVAN